MSASAGPAITQAIRSRDNARIHHVRIDGLRIAGRRSSMIVVIASRSAARVEIVPGLAFRVSRRGSRVLRRPQLVNRLAEALWMRAGHLGFELRERDIQI